MRCHLDFSSYAHYGRWVAGNSTGGWAPRPVSYLSMIFENTNVENTIPILLCDSNSGLNVPPRSKNRKLFASFVNNELAMSCRDLEINL